MKVAAVFFNPHRVNTRIARCQKNPLNDGVGMRRKRKGRQVVLRERNAHRPIRAWHSQMFLYRLCPLPDRCNRWIKYKSYRKHQ